MKTEINGKQYDGRSIPKIIKDQPGFSIGGKYHITKATTGGYRLYKWVAGQWMDASLSDVPALKNIVTAAAAALGSIRSEKKAASSRENGKRGGRPGMYSVEIVHDSGEQDCIDHDLNKSEAITIAKRTATANADAQIYVTFFRRSDGQHGYLNPDGNHAITGKPW